MERSWCGRYNKRVSIHVLWIIGLIIAPLFLKKTITKKEEEKTEDVSDELYIR